MAMQNSGPDDALLKAAFGGVGHAEIFGSGRYLSPGEYVLKLTECKLVQSKDPKKKGAVLFLALFDVELVVYKPDQEVRFAPGDVATWTVNRSQASGASNLAGFLTKLVPEWPQERLDDISFTRTLLGPDSFVVGRRMVADAFNILTSEKKDFTKVNWDLLPDEPAAALPAEGATAQLSAS